MSQEQSQEQQVVDEAAEIIDIEDFARAGRPVPPGRRYRIRVDKERFVVERPMITGREILDLVNKSPDLYRLYQHFRGRDSKIVQPDEKVDLRAPGVERFTTMKIENRDG